MTAAHVWRRTVEHGVAYLTLDRAPRNLLSFETMRELAGQLDDLAGDREVRVVVLRSAVPGYFAAHADLDDLARLAEGPVSEARAWYDALNLLEEMPQPVVAAVNGQAWGGGLELALACTSRLAGDQSSFSCPEIHLGFIPGAGATQRLSRLIGPGAAADLVLTGRVVDADEAGRLGLVQRVWPTGDFAASVSQFAAALAAKSRDGLAAAKQAVVHGSRSSFRDGLRLEAQLFADLLRSDASRALQAEARARYAAASDTTPVRLDDLGTGTGE